MTKNGALYTNKRRFRDEMSGQDVAVESDGDLDVTGNTTTDTLNSGTTTLGDTTTGALKVSKAPVEVSQSLAQNASYVLPIGTHYLGYLYSIQLGSATNISFALEIRTGGAWIRYGYLNETLAEESTYTVLSDGTNYRIFKSRHPCCW